MKSEMGVNRMTESVFSERVRALQGPLWRIAWVILRNGADLCVLVSLFPTPSVV